MDDKKLLKLLHKDPNAAMEQLINQYASIVYAVVKGKLRLSCYASSDIEDCVADVFSEFSLDISKYDPKKSNIKSYLCVLARNNAIDILRKRDKQRDELSLDIEYNILQISDDFEIESEIEEKELLYEVIDAIKNLGEPDASIIFRKFYYGETSKEIASAIGLSVSNVDTRAHRALNKLRKIFGGNSYENNNQ